MHIIYKIIHMFPLLQIFYMIYIQVIYNIIYFHNHYYYYFSQTDRFISFSCIIMRLHSRFNISFFFGFE